MAMSLSSAAISLAALVTFGAVYVLAPAAEGGGSTSLAAVPVEASLPENAVSVKTPPQPVRINRIPRAVEYTYSEQRKLEGTPQPVSEYNPSREQSVYYAGCRDARAAGAAPLYRGDPGYREGMDGDNDGVACEPYRGR
jgi:Excalibur calcium-binding domain